MHEIIDGSHPKIPNSVIVATDGTVYWTDSDTNFALHNGFYTLFTDGTGRYYFVSKNYFVMISKQHYYIIIQLV